MRPNDQLTAVMATTITALLTLSGVGLSDAAVVCICPDGQVKVEVAAICSCCHTEPTDDHTSGSGWMFNDPACSDCVDVPMRVFPLKNDTLRLQPATADTGGRATPMAVASNPPAPHLSRPDQGHRLSLALLSSVVLLT